MAWRFDGVDDQMQFAIAPFSGHTLGNFTYAALFKYNNTGGATTQELFGFFTSSVTTRGYLQVFGDVPIFYTAASIDQAPFTLTNGNWYLLVVTKATGTVHPRFHLYNGTTWSHGAGTNATVADFTVAGTDLFLIGQSISNWLKSDITCYGIKESNSSDVTVETLNMTAFTSWTGFGFNWLVGFDRTTTIPDQGSAGTGGEISRNGGVGASLVSDPPGWSFVAATTPVADFTGTPLSGSGSLTTVFTDVSTNTPTSWAWTFGDGGTSSSQNPSHTYSSPGIYTVALVATNSAGSNTKTRTSYVNVTVLPGAGQAVRIKATAGWIDLAGGMPAPTYGTSPPGSPNDGDTWILPVGNGVLWWFRYNASGSTYKWEFLGGSPLHSDVQVGSSVETTTSTTYAALTTAGPVVVLPRAGDYIVGLGFTGGPSAVYILMSYDIGGTGAVDADAVRLQNAATATAVTSVARHRAQTFATAVTLTAKYKGSAAGTAAYGARWLQVIPVRVS